MSAPSTKGRIGLWQSGSQIAQATADNPKGLRRGLLVSPIAHAREVWIPALDTAASVLGYKPRFMSWMDCGQTLINRIMCADSWTALLRSGTGKPHEYPGAYTETRNHCSEFIVYHGSPEYLSQTPTGARDDYSWMFPAMVSGCSHCFDAQGNKSTAAMKRIASMCEPRGSTYYVEPIVKAGTPWFDKGIGCFVMLQTLRDTIRKDWSPATGAARDYPHVNILVGSWQDLGEEEARQYLARGWHVFYPLDTPPDFLGKFNEGAA